MAGKSKARCVVIFASSTTNAYSRKNSTLIVRLISTAQTGFFYTTQRLRTGPKLAAVKYDPRGMCASWLSVPRCACVLTVIVLFVFTVKRRVLFVESKKTKK